MDTGSVTNHATATSGITTSPIATTTVTAVQSPALTLTKSAQETSYASVGDILHYSYVVLNSGNVTLSGPFTVTDNKVTVTCPVTTNLAPSASITCTASYTVIQADLDAGSITNTATASNGTVTSDQAQATVNYIPIEYTLTITSAHGTVARNPDKATYHYGEVVQLTPIAEAGWTFADWSGDMTGTENPKSITIDENKVITANYTQNEYTVSITVVGYGSVTTTPLKVTYHYGEVIHMQAVPESAGRFLRWSGDYTGTYDECDITVTGNVQIIAVFTQGIIYMPQISRY